MDKRLQILQRLYEDEDGSLRRLLSDADEDLRREYESLTEVKFWLDHRSRERPDPAVLDAIARAAAGKPVLRRVKGAREDREPVAARFARVVPLRMLAAAAVVVAAVGIGLWRLMPLATSEQASYQFTQEAPREAPETGPELRSGQAEPAPAARLADRLGKARSDRDAAIADAEAEEAGVPAWDQSPDVQRLRQRIEILQTRQLDLAWDEPVVPLERMPESVSGGLGPGADLQQAGARREE